MEEGTLHVGTVGFAKRRERYVKKLAFVEVELRTPLPSPRVLEGWRGEVGAAFAFAVTAPATLWGEADWPLRDDKHTQAELDRLHNVARALTPRVIVLRTPRSVRPNTPALTRFLKLADRVKRLAPLCVWDPLGVWERDAAIAAGKPAGLIVASDPLRESVAGEAKVYARMRGLGSDRRYHNGKLEDLADALGEADEAFVVFDTANAYTEAVRFVRIASGAAEEGDEVSEGAEATTYGPDDEDDEEGYGIEKSDDEDDEDDDEDEDDGDEDDDDEEAEDES